MVVAELAIVSPRGRRSSVRVVIIQAVTIYGSTGGIIIRGPFPAGSVTFSAESRISAGCRVGLIATRGPVACPVGTAHAGIVIAGDRRAPASAAGAMIIVCTQFVIIAGKRVVCVIAAFDRIAVVGRTEVSIITQVPTARAIVQRPQFCFTTRHLHLAIRQALFALASSIYADLSGITFDRFTGVPRANPGLAFDGAFMPVLLILAFAVHAFPKQFVCNSDVAVTKVRRRGLADGLRARASSKNT